ncbi:hypothetical protein J3R83DRAFT_2190 [Lanmaoa asiatica]|nr:hypothetical protein J3R83DRAFT_2190 [Lanmaoa asiatica]
MDYASALGVKSLPAAIVFAILYFPFFVYFFSKTIARPVYIYIILTFFCSVRVTAFILRALLSHVPSDADNLHVVLAYEIIYNIGFFGLLYSAYTLVTDRVALANNPPNDPVSRLLRFRPLFRIAMMAAVSVGITGAVQSSLGTATTTLQTGNTLRKVAIYIFLVCSILVLLQTILLARAEFSEGHRRATNKIGSTYGIYILLVICILLIVREVFLGATANDPSRQDNEAFWYPLAALTEFIAIVLFATPGLVPDTSKEP